ncbi:hypothetical protein F2P81_024707 [Scophthalmus maximus]|uniref:Uncharacterized protein n=1 Tax=Scophthalmus maximus TaxID=52904 RepID=A0A6A4RJS4_SCOMX|nr:hypothetical protein F2P81_024707 [Scophthalmus maximus]
MASVVCRLSSVVRRPWSATRRVLVLILSGSGLDQSGSVAGFTGSVSVTLREIKSDVDEDVALMTSRGEQQRHTGPVSCSALQSRSSSGSRHNQLASLQLLFLVQLEIHEEKMKNKDLICRFKTLRLFWSSSLITFLKMNCVNAAAALTFTSKPTRIMGNTSELRCRSVYVLTSDGDPKVAVTYDSLCFRMKPPAAARDIKNNSRQ